MGCHESSIVYSCDQHRYIDLIQAGLHIISLNLRYYSWAEAQTHYGAGSPFMEDLATALHPRHGTLVMNLHGSGPPGPSLVAWIGRLLGRTGESQQAQQAGYDLDSVEGRTIQRTGAAFR